MNKAIIKDYENYLSNDERIKLLKRFEANFILIVNTLGLQDDYPAITYHLYPSEKIKIQEMGEDGYAETDREKHTIYMVYNDDIQPIGPHELVHILTNKLGMPNYVFNEGLAEYFEDFWKAKIDGKMETLRHNDWAKRFLSDNTYISITDIFDDSKFWELDNNAVFSYPESGSFIKYLVRKYGIDRVMLSYGRLARNNPDSSYNFKVFRDTFGVTVQDSEKDWLKTLR